MPAENAGGNYTPIGGKEPPYSTVQPSTDTTAWRFEDQPGGAYNGGRKEMLEMLRKFKRTTRGVEGRVSTDSIDQAHNSPTWTAGDKQLSPLDKLISVWSAI